MGRSAAAVGLPASGCAVGGKLVGLGGVVGDGALFLQVVDIAVRRGLAAARAGGRIVAALMDEARYRGRSGVVILLARRGHTAV